MMGMFPARVLENVLTCGSEPSTVLMAIANEETSLRVSVPASEGYLAVRRMREALVDELWKRQTFQSPWAPEAL